jgi:hypothetical protein
LVVAIASLAAIGFETLLPDPGVAVGSHWCLVCGSFGGVDSILNILLFVPLGVGLALRGFKGTRAVIGMCALSVLIETAQWLVIPGRYSTIGDVLTNSLGGALGYVITRYASVFLRPSTRFAVALTIGWSVLWLAIQTASAFGFSPMIPRSEYYGEISPCLGNYEQFHGRVLRAAVGDIQVPDTRFRDSQRVRQLLLGSAITSVTIIPSGSEQPIAPIVRIADAGEREILLLGQAGSGLVFGMRTGASVLRLRPPLFAVADILPSAAGGSSGLATDTITVRARYSAREVVVKTLSRTSHDRRIAITASLGWTMLLPFQWFIAGTNSEFAASAIWIACLLLPIGYWGGRIVQFRRTRAAMRARLIGLLSTLALLYVGLVTAPHEFGLTAASPGYWLAALIGILAGAGLAARASDPAAKTVQTD